MAFRFGPRRGTYVDVAVDVTGIPPERSDHFETLDLVYRSLCALLYNYVPTSGHPGGSISSGRIVAALVFDTMDYDLAQPDREDADIISYAAGHKAMGLYAMWALRDEIASLAAPDLVPVDVKQRLRLEDLLGFRRNPVTRTPLVAQFGSKALDGHPTPSTPFVRLATGASGVGMASSLGLAFAARDHFGATAPRVHVVEGEGGLTPGRVAEALAAAGTASLGNAIVHVDWNQASIDSNRVCREDGHPGDYVQWTPMELFHLHDWNVVFVPDGKDFRQIRAAQRAESFRCFVHQGRRRMHGVVVADQLPGITKQGKRRLHVVVRAGALSGCSGRVQKPAGRFRAAGARHRPSKGIIELEGIEFM